MHPKGTYTSIERIVDGELTPLFPLDVVSCLSGRQVTVMYVYGLTSHPNHPRLTNVLIAQGFGLWLPTLSSYPVK